MRRRVLWLSIPPLLVALAAIVGGAEPGLGQSSPEGPAGGLEAGRKIWAPQVDDQRCLSCHELLGIAKTSHRLLLRTFPNAACEACHGPAGAHEDDGYQNHMLQDVSAEKVSALCLSCHTTGPDHVTGWADSVFAKQGKSCADCHSIHAESDAHLDITPDEKGYVGDATCATCHRIAHEMIQWSFHQDVLGKVGGGCEGCHGPGGKHVSVVQTKIAAGEEPGDAGLFPGAPGAKACLTCHASQPERHRREFPLFADHLPECTTCHRVHVFRDNPLFHDAGDPLLPEGAKGPACETCHGDVVAATKDSVHASVVAEDGCEKCHGDGTAHGLSGGRARFITDPLKQSPAEASGGCLECHGDKPEHAATWKGGAFEKQGLSCLTCHTAHGNREVQGRAVGAESAGEGGYVGSKACSICHAAPHPDLAKSVHAPLMEAGAQGCEGCHGPGAAHVRGGGAKGTIRNPAAGNLAAGERGRRAEFCLSCHGAVAGMNFFPRTPHAQSGLTCDSCHDPLGNSKEPTRKTDPDLCMGCHEEVRAQFRLPNRHPLHRGAVTCTSCHDPHSEIHGFFSLSLRKERCVECHKQYDGPFLYNHEASRTDGCVICHMPHGSTNRRLLKLPNVASICIQCHVTPASHSLSKGSAFRNCLNCHRKIHGSYVSDKFFR